MCGHSVGVPPLLCNHSTCFPLCPCSLQREADRCRDVVLRMALLRPSVTFTLFDRGRRAFVLRLIKVGAGGCCTADSARCQGSLNTTRTCNLSRLLLFRLSVLSGPLRAGGCG